METIFLLFFCLEVSIVNILIIFLNIFLGNLFFFIVVKIMVIAELYSNVFIRCLILREIFYINYFFFMIVFCSGNYYCLRFIDKEIKVVLEM